LAKIWGGGDVASADGQRFRVSIQTLYAAPSWKYFGEGRGVTYFTFTSDQFTSFYGVVIPGAVRETCRPSPMKMPLPTKTPENNILPTQLDGHTMRYQTPRQTTQLAQ
jgi:hypothetical protein